MTISVIGVKVFPGAQNLPLQVALQQGFFAACGLDVQLLYTNNSIELRDGLKNGDFEVVHTAVDNALAMYRDGTALTVFMGGDSGMNELFVQPCISDITDLKGRTLIVDARDTAYALQARAALLDCGLKADLDYELRSVGATFKREAAMRDDTSCSAAILNPPFSLRSRARGLKSLGKMTALLGPYQATAAFARSDWFHAHRPQVEKYVEAYLLALCWLSEPAHRAACVTLLAGQLAIEAPLAEATLDALLDKKDGLAENAIFDMAGFANVMALRARVGDGLAGGLPQPEEILDLSIHETVLRRLGSTRAN